MLGLEAALRQVPGADKANKNERPVRGKAGVFAAANGAPT
jgi:hypothetical protein